MRVPIIFLLAMTLGASACSSFRQPEPFDDTVLRDRAISSSAGELRVSASLLARSEIEPVFGVDLMKKAIQPVWLEIENGTERPFYYLKTGTDPEYFAPLEVGHGFRSMFASDANAALSRHIEALHFDSTSAIMPGQVVSGFVFTNANQGVKVVNVDLLGDAWSESITLFVPPPDDEAVAERMERVARFTEPELVHIEDAEKLRVAIEGLPCCAENESGDHIAPLNLVVVGELGQWAPAFQRLEFRYSECSPLFAFMRPQDGAATKNAQWVDALPHVVRLWQTPLRYETKPVWIAQSSISRGGRFAHPDAGLDPAMDGARNDVVESLIYSQHLAKIGFAKGAGCEEWSGTTGADTDGLRILMVFEERAISLAEIDFFDWERIVDYR